MKQIRDRQSGLTLIELVVAMVVIAVATSTIILLVSDVTRRSADPMVQEQADAIAQSYVEEILLRPFCDPNDFASAVDCPTLCVSSGCTSCSGNTTNGVTMETRSTYDDICDYDGLTNTGAVDQNNNLIAGLEAYSVTVNVLDDATVSLNGLTGNAGQALLVNVAVSHPALPDTVRLSGFRANY
ncbi:MAG: prepilin-type N-terminal cleavage/methylation domain-containing protein [Gammaproteobacteria bacterium]|nr:prepilin-type N-terminal cleavage/methylation domain-containing protein [Gammaproteobacteria bacterium]MCI0590565.1 prepilin-type N-terminal cleavage/methylation domain-containing protein [Gammaproteobacteria bacterium]